MKPYHPTAKDLQRFELGGLETPLAERIQEHLHRGCGRCHELLSRIRVSGPVASQRLSTHRLSTHRLSTHRPGPPSVELVEAESPPLQPFPGEPDGALSDESDEETSPYEAAFDRVFARVSQLNQRISAERREAPVRVRRLLDQPTPRRLLLVHNSRCFRTLGMAEELVEAAWDVRFDDPKEAEERCEVALKVAGSLSAETYGWRLLEDLRSRIWAHLGNARRIRTDLPGAREAFEASREHLERGTGAALVEAEWCYLRSAVFSEVGDSRASGELLDRALELYQSEGHQHEMGMVMLVQSKLAEDDGDLRRHRALLQDAMTCIDADREPRALLAAVHNLVFSLRNEGRSHEALALLVRRRHLYMEVGGRTSLLRLHWLEGLIAGDMGRTESAMGALQQARRGFEELGLPFETALVSLELAHLRLADGRHRDAAELAAAAAALFDGHGIHREAAAALVLLSRAARRQEATRSLVDEVSRFLERAQGDPEARFRPSPPADPRR